MESLDKNIDQVFQICECALPCFSENLPKFGARQLFPKNCCEEVSIILNDLLNENGVYNFKLIRGTDSDGAHHFWLEGNKLVIDLTAHQFEGITKPFILTPKHEYPLLNVFSKDIHEFYSSAPWDYLNEIKPRIKEIFYRQYFKNKIC